MKHPITRALSLVCLCALILICVGCKGSNSPDAPTAKDTAKVEEPIQGHAGDWCGGHALPESMCTKCNPELEAKFKKKGDWCAEHGYPESACPNCNPMKAPDQAGAAVAAKPGDWCGGHALPESMCTKCNPALEAKFKEKGDWCAAHGFPGSACPVCNPMKAPEKH